MNSDLNFLQTASPLSKKFFSKDNKEILQANMKNLVYKKIGVKIGRQSDEELVAVMRSIFFQHSRNKADKINEQIVHLNKLVLKYCVNNIVSNVMQHQKYIEDINQNKYVKSLPDRPKAMNTTKQLEYKMPW
tara:strand:- start:161 stop:556 length:396 start_codon:yes stop_codon:yes gene_type:complete